MALNRIDLMGRLTRDPEVRYTNSQKPVASFTIAVDRDGKDAGVDFIDIVAWSGTAEFAQKHFHKGDPIVVCGRLQMRYWMDKDGDKRRNAEVVAQSIYFVPKTKQSENEYRAPEYSDMADADGELPF